MKRYCDYCGEKLIESVEPMEKFWQYRTLPPERYDPATGKRRFSTTYKCPKYRDNFLSVIFGSEHAYYAVGDYILR